MSMGEKKRWEVWLSKYIVDPETECWIWMGKRNGAGYGMVRVNYKDLRAHRVFYEKFVGPIPEGLMLRHVVCDNPSCVNYNHCLPGTHGENMQDMAKSGHRKRTHCPRGHLLGQRVYSDGSRCAVCKSERNKRYYLSRMQSIIGLMILAGLIGLITSPQSSEAKSPTKVVVISSTLSIGLAQSSVPVRCVQAALRSYGYSVQVDGVYGNQTTRAVRHFQKSNGLKTDGISGPITQGALKCGAVSVATPVKPSPSAAPSSPAVAGDVEAIIRDVWPDDLEDHAVAIAYRESRFVPTVRNYCCLGIFQIFWSVHKGWLANLGITDASQLFDARINATAAYALYQRDGGWGPWAL